jgi:hypothetical protein
MSCFYTEHLQLRNSTLIQYHQCHFEATNKSFSNKSTFKKGNLNNAYSGSMAAGAVKRIRKALDIFLQLSPYYNIYNPVTQKNQRFRLAFITLTLSTNYSIEHQFCYKNLLKPFLQWLDKTKGNKLYIWKAELQQRGQLHYHLTINSFIHLTEIREKWNYLQRKNGLIKNHENPPSTEIKSVKKIKNIEHYLAKYIAKDSSNNGIVNDSVSNDFTPLIDNVLGCIISCYPTQTFNDMSINGKVWDCSATLKSNQYYTLEVDSLTTKMLFDNKLDDYIEKVIIKEQCTIIKSKEGYINKVLNNDFIDDYNNYKKCCMEAVKFTSKFNKNLKEKLKTKEIIELERLENKFKEIVVSSDNTPKVLF